jgi:hypothetical protein
MTFQVMVLQFAEIPFMLHHMMLIRTIWFIDPMMLAKIGL